MKLINKIKSLINRIVSLLIIHFIGVFFLAIMAVMVFIISPLLKGVIDLRILYIEYLNYIDIRRRTK